MFRLPLSPLFTVSFPRFHPHLPLYLFFNLRPTMEVFTGYGRIPNDADFPENLKPFPETADILYDDRTAEIHSPVIEPHSQLPPQKLRPIRFSGRNLPDFSDATGPENGGVDGTLLSCHAVASPDLGFLSQLSTQKLSVVTGGPKELGEAPADTGCGASSENAGGGVGIDHCPLVDTWAMQQIKSEMDAECMNLIHEGRLLEAELSSCSDDGDESSEATTEPFSRLRKRKRRRKKLELFMEKMMGRLIQKQEQMHKQLMEMIERKERERVIREEAWKQQQIERAKWDEEVRAQETSRSLALISFIQDLLGNEIQIPKSLETPSMEKDEGEIHNQKDFKCDPNNRRWPKSEVQALITVRTALDHKFLKGPKGSVWEEVAGRLSNMGYSPCSKEV
ncbi:hypothetical protein F0562_027046 [Nyssa sinensis]|uniref:Myb-like domain-containing protein n=1 Tax=Nyssa sinensis TaxID=561372 RepID=A0A5J5B695_9ASTE|nr:hypothetical protein F0562_027046 [Nyssa sinensis]